LVCNWRLLRPHRHQGLSGLRPPNNSSKPNRLRRSA
jgi:hypothetical protein